MEHYWAYSVVVLTSWGHQKVVVGRINEVVVLTGYFY